MMIPEEEEEEELLLVWKFVGGKIEPVLDLRL
jgi:hypothetical protein